jgi:hypothetical protein
MGGTHAYSSAPGGTFYVADTKCDSDSVHGNYYLTNGGYSSLANSSGCGTTVQRGAGSTIALVQACTNYGILPDNCSGLH